MSFRPLAFGAQGDAVTILQRSLLLLRLLRPEPALDELVTASFGDQTADALRTLQKNRSTLITGNYDYSTSESLRRALLEIQPCELPSYVVGQITYPNGTPASNLIVSLSDRGMRQERKL